MLKRNLLIATILLCTSTANAQVEIELIPVATGLPNLVDIVHANDDRIFCVLQSGTVRIVQGDSVLTAPFLDITSQVVSTGERGLLGMAFDPDFENNGWFYVHYTAPGGSGISRISRFAVSTGDPNVADPTSQQILFSYQQPAGNHNGGDLDFGHDGYLYIGFGDGGGAGDTQNNAQNRTNPLGALLRIDVSSGDAGYEIPEDNPFINAGGDTLGEIWAYGLRNPWRFGFDALNGDLWIGDVGQNAWEEVDHWPAGDNSGPNFGWRCYEGFVPYNTAGCNGTYVDPVAVHVNSFSAWCSVVGGRVYRGSEFPTLYGRYIYTDYCGGEFFSLEPDGLGGWVNELLLAGQDDGFTCIGEDSALELYAGNKSDGILYRIVDPLHVGMTDRNNGPMFTVYPVPTSEQLIIEGEIESVAALHLFDQSGRILATRSLTNASTRAELNVTDVANGIYVLAMFDRKGRQIARRPISIVH